ncbi:transcriptional regulator [[Kitasatospora] papulosa]|uniref:transcriptional regulator n=1 Tax=[Kitasatospora] papulosa TaxID=1464011 RepID=UPI0036904B27
MRRRDMINGVLGLSVAILTSPAALAAAADPVSGLERALVDPAAGQPAPFAELSSALAQARTAFTGARYTALSAALPGLIATAEATRDAASGRGRDVAHTFVARAYTLATELAVKLHYEGAWVAADRALSAARASGEPQPLREAARVVAIAMRRAGRGGAAVDFLARTTHHVRTVERTATPDALAATSCLLLTAAYTAAVGRRRSQALSLLEEAHETATRLPAERSGERLGLLTVEASTMECDMYRISVHNALGTPDGAIPYAARLDPTRLSSAERAARHWTECTRMWRHQDDNRRAYAALRAMDRVAPEEVRRPAMRALTADLLYSPQHLSGLREFAVHTGAVAA